MNKVGLDTKEKKGWKKVALEMEEEKDWVEYRGGGLEKVWLDTEEEKVWLDTEEEEGWRRFG